MTDQRFNQLMRGAALKPEEITEGWHFCDGMDGLLANSNDPDGDCFCVLNTKRIELSAADIKDSIAAEQGDQLRDKAVDE